MAQKIVGIRLDQNNAGKAVVELIPADTEGSAQPGFSGNESKLSRLVNQDPESLRGFVVGDVVHDLMLVKVATAITE